VKLGKVLKDFEWAPMLQRKMKAVAKGATITEGWINGDGENLGIYVVIGSDGAVRAVWLKSEPAPG
jgi:hypothetical protein